MPLNLSKRQLIIGGIVLAAVVLLVFIFTGIIPGLVKKRADAVNLQFMGFEDRRVILPIIQKYQTAFPNVKIKYKQVGFNDYEKSLLNSLAAGAGPDLFMFHNTWLPKHFDKITPVSESQFTASQITALYPTVVVQDFAPDGVTWALPLYIDTLALFYNKDIFDDNSIALPPKTWLDFQDLVLQLPPPAAAIGGSPDNIHRATDIVNLLMLQTGTPMVDQGFTRANFATQGLAAFNFYLDFSNPASNFYTWNERAPFSIDLFAEGRLPMMFHYRYQATLLKQKAPFLSFGVAPVPQPIAAGPAVTYADYYGLAVSGKSANSKVAWDFVIFATTDIQVSKSYLQSTGLPPALRSLIKENIDNPEIGVFARQALTARSWPQIDNEAVEQSFTKMIKSVLDGSLRSDQAIRQAETEITRLMSVR